MRGSALLSNEEFQMIRILIEAIFPGGVEAKVDEFTSRDMKSNPFLAEWYRIGLKRLNEEAGRMYRMNLLKLDEGQLTGILVRNEKSEFFRYLRDHTLEGMFSDPIYGGNYEAIGWRLLGYAGPTFHPLETLDEVKLPTVYYSLEGIAYEEKAGL
jgi:gluconate 2-dehydrogenase gamma chain